MNSFEIFLDQKQRLVRLTATGLIDYPSLKKMIDAAQKKAVEKGFDILYDVRQTQTKVLIANYFFIPRDMEIFKDTRSLNASVVILTSPKDRGIESYKFYATVLRNLGYRVRLFYDEPDAINWLLARDFDDEDYYD